MSGPFGSSQWMYSSGGFYPHELGQSLRFNDDDSAYLSWTPSSAGNRKTWTWSGWVKRGNLGATSALFVARQDASNRFLFYFNASDNLQIWSEVSNVDDTHVTDAEYRDVSAWYHIVLAYDTTQSTASDRTKIYVNGTLQDINLTRTIPQNREDFVNNTKIHYLGAQYSGFEHFDGYLAEVNFVDGQALDPTDFGEFKSGVWVANEYTGSYGTNGFYLPFTNDYSVEGFNTVTYRGNSGTQYIGGVGFEPDLVWIKRRNGTADHALYDSVRGVDKRLESSTTDAEADPASTQFASFDADGFTVENAFTATNESPNTYVAWAWDAGTGSPVSNTDGSITSSVKANPDYGFSIVSYTGNNTAGATVGHGLGAAPEMIILKDRDGTDHWRVYTSTTGATKSLYLSLTNAAATDSTIWNNTAPTSSVFTIGNDSGVNTNTNDYIAYCFHSVSGYSDFGSYTGNGSTSGPTVTTGFKPAFVMVKRTDYAADWLIIDNTRSTTGYVDDYLSANTSGAEQSNIGANNSITLLSNGFQITGNWTSINDIGGTYIYMAFADKREAAFWLDQSGNNNDWTNNNMQESDISLDSPTNNFATLNPLIGTSNLLEGNLSKNYFVDGSNTTASSTFAIPSSGKWYFEFSKNTSTNYGVYVGITTYVDANDYTGSNYTLYLVNTGGIFKDGSSIATVTADTDTWIVGIAVDADSNNVSFYLNGTLQGTYSYTSVSSDYFAYFAGVSGGSYTNNMLANFGQDSSFAGNKTAQGNTDDNGIGDFYYTPPSGYLALCTSNLPDPVIDPAQDEVPSDYFNTVLYTGNGSTQSITGVGFQPDLVWGKNRSTTGYHQLFDVIRGVTHNLASNSTDAEGTITSLITSFDSDGFSVGNNNDLNQSSTSIVAWNWLAGNGTSSNTDGSITSTVSVNQKAGFSIVSYTGTGSAATVGHGLDSAPEMVIVKNRSVTGRSWAVYNEAIGASNYLALNQTSASASVTTVWNSTAPTSSVFSIGNNTWTGANAEDYIAYCFHSVEGYSKFGSYTGNGSTDGPFVYTGFRPALTIVKRTDASGNSWRMHDDKRGFNGAIDRLHANLSNAEVTGTTDLDVLSNGFKVRTNSTDQNASGGTYIFMAFAENPFKYSNAR